jgi:hypothetical protein
MRGILAGGNNINSDIMLHVISSKKDKKGISRLRLSTARGELEVGKEHA